MSELVIDLNSPHKPKLLLLCAELGVKVANAMWKPQIIQALLALEADDSEHILCWEVLEERNANEEKWCADEKENQFRKLELMCLELEFAESEGEER